MFELQTIAEQFQNISAVVKLVGSVLVGFMAWKSDKLTTERAAQLLTKVTNALAELTDGDDPEE